MANLFHDLDLGNEELTEINAIIEIPKDSMVKYEFDKELNAVKVDRIGKTPIPYSFNYGFLPQSWNKDDHDPLDVIVLSRFPFAPGCIVPARVVGGFKMIDSGEYDYKVVAVADDKYYAHIEDIDQVHEKEKEDIEYFMRRYKDLHKKVVEVQGWDTKAEAIKVLKECKAEYFKKYAQ